MENISSAAVSDTRPEAGAPVRTVYAALRTIPYIDEFRFASDPPDDWSCAFRRAEASAAGRYQLPADRWSSREFPVKNTIELNGNGQLEGGQKWMARIVMTGAPTKPILSLNGVSNTVVRDLHIRYENRPATSTDAVAIKAVNAQTCTFKNLWLAQVGDGIALIGGGNHEMSEIRCYGYEDTAVTFAAGCIDSHLLGFNFFAGDSIRGRLGGLRFKGPVEACTAAHGEIKLGVNSVTTVSNGLPTRGSAPFGCGVKDTRLDSSFGAAALLRSGVHFTFDDCWFASAGHSRTEGGPINYDSLADQAGLDADQMTHLKVLGCTFERNGGRGALFYNTNRHTRLIGNAFARNGVGRSYNVGAAEFLAGSQNFVAQGNAFELVNGPGLTPPEPVYRQNLGIAVGVACDFFDVTGNSWGGCSGFNASPDAIHGSYERNW